MTKKLEKLAVDLVANGEKFKKELAASQTSAERWGKRVSSAITLGSGALIGAGVAATALTVKTAKLGDEIAKNAKAAGIGAETYQAWQFASSQAGVSNDKFASSMERATKRIGEAARGFGGAKKTLDDYNISVFDTQGNLRGTEDVLREFADRLKGMETAAERTAAVTALFGREGIRMGLIFGQGSDTLQEFEDQARSLGLVIDQSILNKAEDAVDQMDIMQRVIKSRLIVAMSELFPTVISIGNSFAAATPKLIEFTDAFLNLVTNSERAQISKVVGVARDRIKVLEGAIAQISITEGAVGDDKVSQERLARAKANALAEIEVNKKIIEDKIRELSKFERDQRKIAADLIDAESLLIGGGSLSAGDDQAQRFAQQRRDALRTQALMDAEATELEAAERKYERLQELAKLHTEFLIEEEVGRAARVIEIEQDLQNNRFLIAQDAAALIGSLAKDGSALQKAAFIAEKAIAIAQVRVNTEIAAIRALAELGPIAGPPVAASIRAQGLASQILIGATAIAGLAGQAHSGLTNVPKEGTYLLDRGERVVQPRQNEDLTRFLSQSQQPAGVTINYIEAPGSNTEKTFSTEMDGNGQLQVFVREQIRSVIRSDLASGRGVGSTIEQTYRNLQRRTF
ncbi:MAG: phage tail tape measure protein [Pseudomonadaceae bacterium]|nr:phage tail tape measure protein [Pseudomonadaceae bacterium]